MKKEAYEKLSIFFSFLKVATLCVAAVYLVFWFYRFFNLPFVDYLATLFDFPLRFIPLPFETLQIYENNHVAENGYFVMGVLLSFVTFIFSRLEIFSDFMETKSELKELRKKREFEEKMNRELQKSHLDDLLKYKYFSIYIKYKIRYANEVIAQNNSLTIVEIVERAYTETANHIRKTRPNLGVRQNKASIFIRGLGFEDFDGVFSDVLDGIKIVKTQNEKDYMYTDFIIAIDAQTNEEDCSKSYNRLAEIGNMEYQNKAILTPAFKGRFELVQKESKFTTEVLCTTGKENQTDFYIMVKKRIN